MKGRRSRPQRRRVWRSGVRWAAEPPLSERPLGHFEVDELRRRADCIAHRRDSRDPNVQGLYDRELERIIRRRGRLPVYGGCSQPLDRIRQTHTPSSSPARATIRSGAVMRCRSARRLIVFANSKCFFLASGRRDRQSAVDFLDRHPRSVAHSPARISWSADPARTAAPSA